MRTIKFRGKKEENGEWVYGYYAAIHVSDQSDSDQISQGIQSIPSILNDDLGSRDRSNRQYWNTVVQKTVGQYTGVKDINGREIYEGDIVRVRVSNNRFKKNPKFQIGFVSFDNYEGGWTNNCYLRFYPNRMEVIGNIFDNPELLEGGAK